jgi:DNA replication protein DnaC
MKLFNSRTLRPVILAAVIIALSILINILVGMTSNKLGDYLQAKFGISTTALVYVLIFALPLLVLFTIYDASKKSEKEGSDISPQNIESEVEKLLRSLKEGYQNRYEQKLDGRFEITLEVSKDWNSRRPRVIKEKFSSEANVGEAVEVINEAFKEKGSLLIVGNPGAGKTVLLLKLAVSLLDKINASGREAIPFIFNLASWSPKYERFEDWVKAALESGYGLSKEFAEDLLRQERIVFLLDGLDELGRNEDEKLAAELRGELLKSLNQYLNRGKKVVICCRRDEFVQIKRLRGQDAPVAAKVALLDLTKTQIENALLEAIHRTGDTGHRIDATSASHILEFLKQRRSKVLLDVLRTPFYFTTALEVFDKSILDKDQLPNREDALKKYLLDKFIETKLNRTPNPNKFNPAKTRWWLTWIAIVLTSKQQIAFELSDLQIYHLETQVFHTIFTGVCFGLITELFILCMLGKAFWGIGFPAGCLSIQAAASLGLFKRLIVTEDIRHWNLLNIFRWETWARWLRFIIITTVLAGLFGSVLVNKLGTAGVSPAKGFLFVAVPALVILVIQISINASEVVSFYTHIKTPYQRLFAGIGSTIIKFLLIGMIMSSLVMYELDHPQIYIIVAGGALSMFTGLMTTPLFRHLMLRLCFYIERRLPLKCATFLDYAAEARILEKDGGQWRFRHQNLQDYFAKGEYLKRLTTKARKRGGRSTVLITPKNSTT